MSAKNTNSIIDVNDRVKRVKKPQRWDQSYAESMSTQHFQRIERSAHFLEMNAADFTKSVPLDGIIRNDCRIKSFAADEFIVHQGDYLNSLFIVLSGSVKLLSSSDKANISDNTSSSVSLGSSSKVNPSSSPRVLKRWWRRSHPEQRSSVSVGNTSVSERNATLTKNIGSNSLSISGKTLQKLIATDKTTSTHKHFSISKSDVESMHLLSVLVDGDVFAESAVLGRHQMYHHAVAETDVEVVEIRWQGVKELCRRSTVFKQYLTTLYRQRGLTDYLASVDLFANVTQEQRDELAHHALFETYGEFEWQQDFKRAVQQSAVNITENEIKTTEPIIAEAGDYPDGVLLLRHGFARINCGNSGGEYTLGYLRAGQLFGYEEVYKSWKTGKTHMLDQHLRALGYADVIRIPSWWLEKYVFGSENESKFSAKSSVSGAISDQHTEVHNIPNAIEREFSEFLIEHRYINGTQTMMIDLERCVRCDDCVSACADAHDGNPRFNRQGPRFGAYMLAQACMHCQDPVCMIGCPTGAIHRANDGLVSINDSTCIGCSTCANNCPYNSIRMVPVRHSNGDLFTDKELLTNNDLQNESAQSQEAAIEPVRAIMKATKCDLCQSTNGKPACVNACSHDALIRIDVKDDKAVQQWVSR